MIPQIIVVDDDQNILKLAWNILSDAGMKVVVLKSGKQLLKHLEDNPKPDLILLDISMPEMDGFETYEKLRSLDEKESEIPVIFLTGSEDDDAESKGLEMGAMDFIRKPMTRDVLELRVRHAVELTHLQKNLKKEVADKTREYKQLLLHVVGSLADSIDAKDAYTNGHSGRVAMYAREIAMRYGYDEEQQNHIYMMGLLHDVGKIGVPDEVINKTGRLTDEEFACIKKHPTIGARILGNIKEMPELSLGARYHHERYDGKGYPEGLVGDNIPEESRIIAVADAYDAMTSNRSYRGALSQEEVRNQIINGKGTQFDPVFADIMLKMIEEDTEYRMRDLNVHERNAK